MGLLILALLGVVGGGSEYLILRSAHVSLSHDCGANAAAVAAGQTGHCTQASRRGTAHMALSSYSDPFQVVMQQQPHPMPVSHASSVASYRAPVHKKPVYKKPPAATQTPTATPTPAPAGGGNSSVVSMIDQVFGSYAQEAISVARCESGLNPAAYNAGSHASGIFQILYPSTWDTTGYGSYSPFDASANVKAAHVIFVRDGYSWREWTCR
jgi:Transglycosylase-like domain